MPLLRALCVALLLLQITGCAGWLRGNVGFATSTSQKARRPGVALDADAAFGPENSLIMPDIGLHARAAASAGNVAVSAGAIHIGLFGPIGWYALGSLSMLEIGSTDAQVSFGMFGPAAEVGLVLAPSVLCVRPLMLTLGTRFEYDLRFTSQPHEGFWSLNLGAAFGRAK
jgi:hypothetical protein